MSRNWRRWLGLAAIAGSFALGAAARAQEGFQPLKALFGPHTGPAPKAKPSNPNRLTEIQVELAWLSDAATFPYYLEAHVKGSTLEARGYVPSKAVHIQALNLAKLNCPLPVTDAMKEHASLTVRTTHRTPAQLQSAVETALHDAFPAQRFGVTCTDDGTVQVSGSVRTIEQKLAVSQTLRRLHGCTRVSNDTQVGGVAHEPDAPDRAANDPQDRKRGGIFGLLGKTPSSQNQAAKTQPAGKEPANVKVTTAQAPGSTMQPVSDGPSQTQVEPGDAYESRGLVVLSPEEPKTVKTALPAPTAPVPAPLAPAAKTAAVGPATVAALKKRIESGVPAARNVVVTFTSKTDVRVECAVRPDDDANTVAGQILGLRELDPYKVDLQIKVPTAEQK
jgi:hypothetical protein